MGELELTVDIVGWTILAVSAFSLLISVPLYIAVLFTICRRKRHQPFQQPFFTLFVVLGVADLGCYSIIFVRKLAFFDHLPSFFGPIGQSNTPTRILWFFNWVFASMQYMLLMALSVNRFTAICLPLWHKTLWSDRNSRIYLFIIILFSIGIAIPCLLTDLEFRQIAPMGTQIVKVYGPYYVPGVQEFYFGLWQGYIYALTGVCVFCYTTAIARLSYLSRISVISYETVEIRLFYTGFAIFVFCLLFVAYFIAGLVISTNFPWLSPIYQWVLCIVSDLFDLHNQYMILLISGEMRRALREIVFGRASTSKIAAMPAATVTNFAGVRPLKTAQPLAILHA